MAKAFLALDLAAMTGWAYRLHDAVISGRWDLRPGRSEDDGARFARFTFLLNELHAAQPIGSLSFVGLRAHKDVDAAHLYGGLLATLTLWCEGNSVSVESVPVGEIKKFATGRGNASKDEMTVAAEDWGYRPIGDNEALALCLLHLKTGEPVPRMAPLPTSDGAPSAGALRAA